MKVLEFAIDVFGYLLAIATARLISHMIPEWSFESAMLAIILWQVTVCGRKEVK